MADSEIKIRADISGVQAGVHAAKISLISLADTAQAQGRRGAEGVKQVGNAADDAAKKAEAAAKRQQRASDNYTRQLQRELALTQAGKRGTVEYHEAVMKLRGIEATAQQRAILETLRKNQALQESVRLQKEAVQVQKEMVGNISIGQYNNAMRMLPAQFTDVVTQLAGGQNPLLIALQQGGQTRDIFGGFGNMFKGIASLISPVKIAMAGLAGGVAAVGAAAYQGSQEIKAYENALVLAGGAAGVSAGQLQNAAVAVGNATGGYGQAREAVLAFVAEGKIGADSYQRFSESVVRQSQATGQSVGELVQQYTSIAEDPVKAVQNLSATYKSMTADVYRQVKALQAQGREQEAVALVQNRYAAESDEMAKRVLENLGSIESGWKSVKEAAAGVWDDLKNIGRQQTIYEQLLWTQEQLAKGESLWNEGFRKKLLQDQERLIALLVEERRQQAKTEAEDRQRKNQLEGLTALDKISETYATREEQRKKKQIELEKAYKKAIDGVTDAKKRQELTEQYQREKGRINEAYAEKEKKERQKKTPIDSLSENQKKLYALTQKYGEDPAKWLALYQIESRSGKDLINERSGASGHFQIMPQYFRDYGVNRAGAMDLETSFHATRRHHARGSAKLQQRLGRELTAGEYYLGHQQGWGGATALLSNPDKNVVDALATIMSRGRAQASVTQNGGKSSMTARQFAEMWMQKANKLQADFAGKGIGSLDSGSAGGLEVFEVTAFDKWAESFAQSQHRMRVEMQLTAENAGKTFNAQLALLTNPEFENFGGKQKEIALESVKQADAQENLNRTLKKYTDITERMQEKAKQQLDDKLFEISLIGKTREEIEKLTLARLWDQKIVEAQKENAPPEMIAQMQTGKTQSLEDVERAQQAQKQVDDNWRGGFSRGMQEYIDSFGSMNDAIADATSQTFDRMGDAIADFVATGKLDFRGLAVSILQDLSKMLVKMAIVNAMKAALGGYADGGVVGGGEYSSGGYTGHGGKHEPAGVVHKGEVVFSQRDVARHGGVAMVERLRLKGYADGGVVGLPPQPGSRAAANAGNTTVNITINQNGGAESDSRADTEMGKALAQALPGMIEQWYVKNVARPGAVYNKG